MTTTKYKLIACIKWSIIEMLYDTRWEAESAAYRLPLWTTVILEETHHVTRR